MTPQSVSCSVYSYSALSNALSAASNGYSVSHTGDPSSFAHETARTRWPKILTSAIDEIKRTASANSSLTPNDVNAGQEIYSQINTLKADMHDNAPLHPIPDDGAPDVMDYNEELATLNRPTWLNSPWLYTECYLYRLMHTFFTTSTTFWQTFDMFVADKRKALVGSKKGTIELVKRFNVVLKAIAEKEIMNDATQKALVEEMIQISLWGNATDLSLLTSLSVEQLESRQGKAVRDESKRNVLVDDTAEVQTLLMKLKSEPSTCIHIVLDNAGFELLADLVFAGFLVESGCTKRIVLHGKRMPWFVSDVMERDLADLIEGFADGTAFPDIDAADREQIMEAGKYWQNLQRNGALTFFAEPFWTTAHSYGRMAEVDPQLFDQLASGDLVVYKGDLNYRKLTYDGQWPHITSFKEALGPLATQVGGKGIRTLVLRTAKADVGVGLKPEQEEGLPEDWTRTGKYAMISYCDAKS